MGMVVFDLGGVLVKIAENWQMAAQTAKISGIRPEIGVLGLAAFPGFEPYQAGKTADAEFLAELQDWLGLDNPDSALKVHQGILVEPYPGTLELVQQLHSLGLQTGCLSNTNAPHWDRMSDPNEFPAIASLQIPGLSHLLKAEKPHAEIYEKYEALAATNGRNLVFFDDSMGNVEAAKACGWRAHRINPAEDTAAQMRFHLAEYGLAVAV